MTLDQIRYFLAAAKFQHVGRAARSVFISPSSVSSAIAALEDELDSRLFERKSQRIFLTPTGQDVRRWAEGILGEVDSLKHNLKKSRSQLKGIYRLGAAHFLASRVLAQAWFALQEGNPELIGELRSMDGAMVISDVLSGRLDLGLCFNPVSHPELDETLIHRGTIQLVVRKGHPILRESPARRLKGLQAYPAVMHKVLQGVDISQRRSMFQRFDIQPRTVLAFDDPEIAFAKLRTSDFWSFLPDIMIASGKELCIAVRPAGWDAPCDIKVVRHRDRPLDRVLHAFIAELRNRLSGRSSKSS